MKSNVGNTDKAVRISMAILLAALYFTGTISGIIGVIALVVAGVFVLTSLVGFCPLYAIFGMSTCPRKTK
ncbi:MAG: DUF2892 domain-containing protein [Bacteroidia bacterium]